MTTSNDADRSADRWAIQDLTVAYADAVDARDWGRFESLFHPEARIDYVSAGGIAGTPAEVSAWMPEGLSLFTWTMHSISTHAVDFDGPDQATGSLHVLARHGLTWDGEDQLMDVGGIYEDRYVRLDGRWVFGARTEHTRYINGGAFAAIAREAAGLDFGG